MQDYSNTEGALRELYNHSSQLSQDSKTIPELLSRANEENDSEDEGIEDYKLGGYHPVHVGEVLIGRYVVIQKLGWGHFSTVWLCRDFKHQTYVAVKIQKSSPHYMDAAFDEVEILQKVQRQCQSKSQNQSRVVGLLNAFIHKTYFGNHFCMVFQILSCNLLEVIKRYNYEGVPISLCQEISKQVLEGLDFLHRVCGVIHTDLKPENVMVCLSDEELRQIVENGQLQCRQIFTQRLRVLQEAMGISANLKTSYQHLEEKISQQGLSKNQKKKLKRKLREQRDKQNSASDGNSNISKLPLQELFNLKKGKISFKKSQQQASTIRIKIADLGNACWKHHHFSSQIQTRQYRSPEVILGQTYNQTADIWSFGCMMYEMLTGDLLFHPRKSQAWSKNQDHLAQIQELVGPFHPHFILRSPKYRKYFDSKGSMKKFPDLSHYSLDVILQIKNRIDKQQAQQFAKFLAPTLVAQPEKRISAQNALKLPWLKRQLPLICKMQQTEYAFLKANFREDEQRFKAIHHLPLSSDANTNWEETDEPGEDERIADIRYIDRSFTDIDYIGYSSGISLGQLDRQGNWQF